MEEFFRIVGAHDELEIKELLFRRYSNIEEIYKLDASEFLDFVERAFVQETEDKLYQEWLAVYPYMIMKYLKFMPFREYADKAQGKHIDMRPASVIIAEIEEAHRKARGE